MEADLAISNEAPDVSGCRLTDLVERRDPALLEAVERLVAELALPFEEKTSGWSNFVPPYDGGRG